MTQAEANAAASGPGQPQGRFYGWPMAVVAWFLYGLGVMPFYSWGFLLPEMLEELSLSRAQGGAIYGVGLLFGGLASPWVGVAIGRFGTRATMTFGFVVSSIAYFLMGWANGFWYLVVVYGVFSSAVHAFATVIPTQNIASTWFLRYRARVMAVLLSAAGIMALTVVYPANAWLVENANWRTGWVAIGALNVVLGIVALIVIRDSPESIGQFQDGAKSREELDEIRAASKTSNVDDWSAGKAIRTPQFALMLLCGLGYALPWYVLNNHGRLHLSDLGFDVTLAATILGSMAAVSTVGRLSGAMGDFLPPPRLLGLALTIEATGVLVLLWATTQTLAYVAVVLVGLGFGMAYISQATTFALFFGRKAFATTTGIRFMFGAFFTSSIPALAGWAYDVQGTYFWAFLSLALLTYTAAVVAFVIQPPASRAA